MNTIPDDRRSCTWIPLIQWCKRFSKGKSYSPIKKYHRYRNIILRLVHEKGILEGTFSSSYGNHPHYRFVKETGKIFIRAHGFSKEKKENDSPVKKDYTVKNNRCLFCTTYCEGSYCSMNCEINHKKYLEHITNPIMEKVPVVMPDICRERRSSGSVTPTYTEGD